ncbi:hypothetical protein [Natronorubrum bangense]|uniref:Uncharacterized protein n=2 Tax=Natronorubrum bangense TaxID=61858 RepID=A0A4D6HH80_9EURY|nr:hypothetical protein [Natronorubrum bangense]ELY43520.1 hypothetical protein C494_18433 [Natronorubrum bangense JCM 10635]QCC53120.1 hypothetical protein DV706_00660 [Natronorubrum bangense]QCC56188.1 hypothetical protein DV706_16610 [Natronorubrum bangense]
METRWATVDGVYLELPNDCTADELRTALRKPADAVLIAVTGDLVSVVHDEEQSLTEMVAGCADTYYFRRPDEPDRNDVLSAPELESALAESTAAETTFQRPGIDH